LPRQSCIVIEPGEDATSGPVSSTRRQVLESGRLPRPPSRWRRSAQPGRSSASGSKPMADGATGLSAAVVESRSAPGTDAVGTPTRELAQRRSGEIDVLLLWHPELDRVGTLRPRPGDRCERARRRCPG
jgi:hypothetical protein